MFFSEPLAATWVILIAILGPAGCQGTPKIDVLAPSRIKISKNDVQNEASEKASVFNRKLFGKSEFLKVLNPQKCFIYKHLGGFSTL